MARTRRKFRGNRLIAKDNLKYLMIVLICIVVVSAVLLIIRAEHAKRVAQKKEQERQEIIAMILNEEQEIEESTPITKRSRVNMIILGNVLCSDELNQSAYNKETETYDYTSIFGQVSEYTKNADLTLANLETNFYDNHYTGGSKYNSPRELAKNLKEMGVSVANMATNHSFNYGVEGVTNTKNALTEMEIESAGIKTPKNDSHVIKEIRGIKIAFLNYTYGLNDAKEITEEHKSYVNITNKEQVKQDMEKMRQEGADFVCVTMHWQTSKNFTVTEEQKEMANFLVEQGADIIIGTHPNQVESMEVRQTEEGKNVLIVYSIGNFLSTQSNLGMILEVQLNKEVTGEESKAKLTKVKFTPTYLQQKNRTYELLDIRKVVSTYENENNKIVDKKTYKNLKKALEEIEKRIGRE